MKKNKPIILLIILISSIYNCLGQTVLSDPHWELIWEDHFNNLSSIWEVRNNYDHYGEPQVYTNRSNNVYISNGNLVLQMNEELYHCTDLHSDACNKEWYSYTSGCVESIGAYDIQYGLIQAKVKLPYGYGFFPAFWTLVGNSVSPFGSNAAEIDIFEMLGHLPSNIITTNMHTCYPSGICEPSYYQESTMGTYTSYHIYSIAWSPSKIVWYVDGFPIRISDNIGIIDPVKIILNFALYKYNPPNSSTPFPSKMYVDFVKVHQLRNDCNNNLIINNSNNFLTLDNKVKKSITINNSVSIPSSTSVYLRASQSFLIAGSFTVPIGSSFFVDVNPCH